MTRSNMVERDDAEIDEMLNKAADAEQDGRTNWPGMTYEQGVSAALRWVLGWSDDDPMAD